MICIISQAQRRRYVITAKFYAVSTLFPNLKIEFLGKPKQADGVPFLKFVKESGKTFGECRAIHNKGPLIPD